MESADTEHFTENSVGQCCSKELNECEYRAVVKSLDSGGKAGAAISQLCDSRQIT